MSPRFRLNQQDIERWSYNFVRFVAVPTIIAFLLAKQGDVSNDIAMGVAVGTLYTSLIDFLRKFLAGEAIKDTMTIQTG